MRANLDFVTERLAIGGDLHEDDAVASAQLHQIVDLGITHIVDCREEWSDEAFVADRAPNVGYRHVGVDDDGGRLPTSFFEDGAAFTAEALRQPGTKVLVHCHMGINRGPSLGFAVLLRLGWEPIAALDAIRSARPIAAISYSDQALQWYMHSEGATGDEISLQLSRVRQWHKDNWIDVRRIIRAARQSS